MVVFSFQFIVVLGTIAAMMNAVSGFMSTWPMKQRLSVKSLRMASEIVKGDEGLLDPNRMERALKGTGIKVPSEKRLRVGIIGGGLGAMITALELVIMFKYLSQGDFTEGKLGLGLMQMEITSKWVFMYFLDATTTCLV
jgi:hypothetical protein